MEQVLIVGDCLEKSSLQGSNLLLVTLSQLISWASNNPGKAGADEASPGYIMAVFQLFGSFFFSFLWRFLNAPGDLGA